MSAQAIRGVSFSGHEIGEYAVPGFCGAAFALGTLLGSVPLAAAALVPFAIWIVLNAPEVLLPVLGAQGTLQGVEPFASSPVTLLYVLFGLLAIGCALRLRSDGFPSFGWPAVLMVVLVVMLLLAALTSSYPGGTFKAVYFEVTCGALFFAPLVLVRDVAGFVRIAAGFVVIGLLVAHAAIPGATPNQPFTVPGGNEITAAYFPAMGAVAALSCLAMRTYGLRRTLLFALAGLLAAAAVRTGSRGVLVALIAAVAVALLLLVVHARRPALALGLALLVAIGGYAGVRQVAGPAALERYSALTSDSRRDYLRTQAIEQSLDHPMGVGIGGYGNNLPVISLGSTVPYPHNILLEVVNESGLIALDALLALLAAAFVVALRLARMRGLAFCVAGVTFAFVEALASGNVNDNAVLWLMLGLTFAVSQTPEARGGRRAQTA